MQHTHWAFVITDVKLLVVLAGCALLSIAGAAQKGRLVGRVEIGPMTPVERPGHHQTVPPAIYKQYTVVITQPGPHNERMKSHLLRIVARLKLTGNGDFSTNLAPGEYRVDLEAEKPMMHPPMFQTVNVKAGKTTKVTIRVDTGIR